MQTKQRTHVLVEFPQSSHARANWSTIKPCTHKLEYNQAMHAQTGVQSSHARTNWSTSSTCVVKSDFTLEPFCVAFSHLTVSDTLVWERSQYGQKKNMLFLLFLFLLFVCARHCYTCTWFDLVVACQNSKIFTLINLN